MQTSVNFHSNKGKGRSNEYMSWHFDWAFLKQQQQGTTNCFSAPPHNYEQEITNAWVQTSQLLFPTFSFCTSILLVTMYMGSNLPSLFLSPFHFMCAEACACTSGFLALFHCLQTPSCTVTLHLFMGKPCIFTGRFPCGSKWWQSAH